jgi:hypothetical protein
VKNAKAQVMEISAAVVCAFVIILTLVSLVWKLIERSNQSADTSKTGRDWYGKNLEYEWPVMKFTDQNVLGLSAFLSDVQ